MFERIKRNVKEALDFGLLLLYNKLKLRNNQFAKRGNKL